MNIKETLYGVAESLLYYLPFLKKKTLNFCRRLVLECFQEAGAGLNHPGSRRPPLPAPDQQKLHGKPSVHKPRLHRLLCLHA